MQLGLHLALNEFGATLGANGGLVNLLVTSGVTCICHETSSLQREVQAEDPATINYGQAAASAENHLTPLPDSELLQWGLRLTDWAAKSHGFVFFPGREGTLAHLMPVLAFCSKLWAKSGEPRKVVLLGWREDRLGELERLMGWGGSGFPEWLKDFQLDEVKEAVEFLAT
ncbi:hypothetical protein ACFL04_04790 [Patescibacteria group bacterium]